MSPATLAIPLATAIRRVFLKGYRRADLKADLMAGVVVGIVALPLSMALAIAVGVPPQHGLYTAMVAGAAVGLLGGCKFQITGPTAAFVVVLAPIVTKHGLAGLLTAGMLAGIVLVALGAARMGDLIRFIPYPVTTGFTTGIAAVIATLQVKDILGLQTGPMPDHYTDKLAALWRARGSASLVELVVAVLTFALLVLLPRVSKRVPAPLLAITGVTLLTAGLHRLSPGFNVATIGTRFHTTIGGVDVAGVPGTLPVPALPWGAGLPSMAMIADLIGPAFAIAMLAAIESLLSAVIADGMTRTKHDPNAELVGLGIGNILAPLFGGIAATGALARTATNIRSGARSPISAVVHALVILASILLLSRAVSYVPMASLAALLLLIAWNMSEVRVFARLLRVAPKSDVLVLATCFLVTVFVDMVASVTAGFILAAILFMKRMSDLTQSRFTLDASHEGRLKAPPNVVIYEINGPLFFGAAQKAMATLGALSSRSFDVLVLHLGRVPVIDATGLVALETAIEGLFRDKKHVILAGPLPHPEAIFDKAKLEAKFPALIVTDALPTAVMLSADLASEPLPTSGRSSVSRMRV